MSDRDTPAERPKRAPFPPWWWEQTLQTRRLIAGVVVVACLAASWGVFGILRSDLDPGIAAEAAAYVARLPPARVQQWDSLAECESGGDWAAATGNGFYGGLQISQPTWLEVGGTGTPNEATRDEQIMRAESIYELQGWGAWPNCSAELGLS